MLYFILAPQLWFPGGQENIKDRGAEKTEKKEGERGHARIGAPGSGTSSSVNGQPLRMVIKTWDKMS